MNRVPPIAILLLLHIHAKGDPIPKAPAWTEWLVKFYDQMLICRVPQRWQDDHGWALTDEGLLWLERVLTSYSTPPYGGKGYYIIGKDEPAFETMLGARIEAMQKIDGRYAGFRKYYGSGAYILKAVELLEPLQEPRFKTTLC